MPKTNQMRLDMKDRRILYELSVNARQTNSRIGRKVRMSEQMVGYRIRNLIERRVIKYFFAAINTPKLGYTDFTVFYKLYKTSVEKEEEFYGRLSSHSNTAWVFSCRGQYDCVATIYAKDALHFAKLQQELLHDFGENILDSDLDIVIGGHSFPPVPPGREEEPKELPYRVSPVLEKIDETDKKLLAAISTNARMPLVELAEEIGLSPDAARYRLKNLEKKEVITGYHAKVDLGYRHYMMLLNLQKMTERRTDSLRTFAKLNGVYYILNCIGAHDMEIEIERETAEEYDSFIRGLRQKFSDVLKSYETLEIKKEYKLDFFPNGLLK